MTHKELKWLEFKHNVLNKMPNLNERVARKFSITCDSCKWLMFWKEKEGFFECEMCDNIKLVNKKQN